MLITDRKALQKYQAGNRLWQGIPSIEVTRKGRVFVSFYSGGTKEYFGNYCALEIGDTNGNFGDVAAVIDVGSGARAYDACLWIDPLGRLWWIYSVMPDHAVYAYICDDPDGALLFYEAGRIGYDVMLNKPTVLSTGEWLFPISVIPAGSFPALPSPHTDSKAWVYKTVDNGRSFCRLGGAVASARHFDEHMIVERRDGSLFMLIRTRTGIAQSLSYDGGKTWTEAVDSGLGGPDSRFFIRRLRSGRLLLVNHKNFDGRNNLTAMLSDDDGRTWSEGLLLDERKYVAYPDAVEDGEGYIWIVYDRDRGSYSKSLEECLVKPRELLLARVTEEDILAERVIDPKSFLKKIVDKLGAYSGDDPDPFRDYKRADEEYVRALSEMENSEAIIAHIFRDYGNCCYNLDKKDQQTLDLYCTVLKENENGGDICHRIVAIERILEIFLRFERAENDDEAFVGAFIDRVRDYVGKNIACTELGLDRMADDLNISKYYMCHIFKNKTGVTVSQYINYRRLATVKRLLVETDRSLVSVCMEVGFVESTYFSKWFKRLEGMTPREYRDLHRITERSD